MGRKQAFRRHVLLKLNQPARIADQHMEGEKRLHAVDAFCIKDGFAQWRLAEIDQCVFKSRAAQTACPTLAVVATQIDRRGKGFVHRSTGEIGQGFTKASSKPLRMHMACHGLRPHFWPRRSTPPETRKRMPVKSARRAGLTRGPHCRDWAASGRRIPIASTPRLRRAGQRFPSAFDNKRPMRPNLTHFVTPYA